MTVPPEFFSTYHQLHAQKERRRARSQILFLLAIGVLFLLSVWSAWDFTQVPKVYYSNDSKEVVEVRDWRDRPVPEQQWDKVLSERFEPVWVK